MKASVCLKADFPGCLADHRAMRALLKVLVFISRVWRSLNSVFGCPSALLGEKSDGLIIGIFSEVQHIRKKVLLSHALPFPAIAWENNYHMLK